MTAHLGMVWRGSTDGRRRAGDRGHGHGERGPEAGRPRRTPIERERGAGTVLTLGLLSVVIVLAVVLAGLAVAESARGRAQAAADLGALAGATEARYGGDACAVATATVERNGARVTACSVASGGVVRVDTACSPGAGVLGAVLGDATAKARAGPAAVLVPLG